MSQGDAPAGNISVATIIFFVALAIMGLLYFLKPTVSDLHTKPGIEAPAVPVSGNTPSSANSKH